MVQEKEYPVMQYMCPQCLKVYRYIKRDSGMKPKCRHCGTFLEEINLLR